jgi:NitT/TauT family transport system substrate-binding protein
MKSRKPINRNSKSDSIRKKNMLHLCKHYHPRTDLRNRFSILFLTLFALYLAGCNSRGSSTSVGKDGQILKRVVLMLNWYPEAEHGGFYAAQVHGIFEKYGLDVEIRPGGPNAPVAQELLTGRVDFAIGNADDVLLFRQERAPVVALMAPIQNTPRCVLVHESSPVQQLSELSGMTLQANVGRPFLNYLDSKGYLENVRVVPYAGSVANFVVDKNTAIQAYSFSEPFLAQQDGVKSRALMLSDIGFNPYASCLITTESLIAKDRDLVQRMVSACREGWVHYLEQPGETNQQILQLNSHGMTAEALEYGANAIRPLCLPDGMSPELMGTMSAERWQTLYDQFTALGLVSKDRFQSDQVFTLDFIK